MTTELCPVTRSSSPQRCRLRRGARIRFLFESRRKPGTGQARRSAKSLKNNPTSWPSCGARLARQISSRYPVSGNLNHRFQRKLSVSVRENATSQPIPFDFSYLCNLWLISCARRLGINRSSGSPAASCGRERNRAAVSGCGSFSKDRPMLKSGW